MVFFSHAIGLLPETGAVRYLQQSPFRILWDGAAAVDLFFVLSGFVLALPFVTTTSNPNYVSYVIRRVFRLYPAFWLALVVSIVLRQFYSHEKMMGLSEWAQILWIEQVTSTVIARHVPVLLKTSTNAINPVVWSLIVEMRMSLLLPLIIYLLNRIYRPAVQRWVVVIIFVLAIISDKFAFFPLFVLGAILAKNFFLISRLIIDLCRPVIGLGMLIAVFYTVIGRFCLGKKVVPCRIICQLLKVQLLL